MNYQDKILKVIIHAGNAKSHIYEALHWAKKNDFKKCDEYMEKANEEILEAQKIQTGLINKDADGKNVEISMLLIHSQDHLMTCLSERNLVKEIIDLRKEINTNK
ncbi:PTS lactose/cellobiose transporter subunit IIA [Paraclostridium bifermentans]|uniref:PTS lactose/cellobiose transporter subunit IIA n=1 Tax=Paraclostridium bifermentans TaxID=1490 RepID=UPI00359C3DF1